MVQPQMSTVLQLDDDGWVGFPLKLLSVSTTYIQYMMPPCIGTCGEETYSNVSLGRSASSLTHTLTHSAVQYVQRRVPIEA